jgi:hypothetical protein
MCSVLRQTLLITGR